MLSCASLRRLRPVHKKVGAVLRFAKRLPQKLEHGASNGPFSGLCYSAVSPSRSRPRGYLHSDELTERMAKRKSPGPSVEENPAWLDAPPCGAAPAPPIETKLGELPFGKIEWPDFERLCRVLAAREALVEHVLAYGEHGQAQYGIDLLVRLKDGAYEVWQTKRYRKMKPSDVRDAVQMFRDHRWAAKAKKFVLATACPMRSTGVVEAIEAARDLLTAEGKAFEPLDAQHLSERMRTEPEMVDDFFGRPWALAFCPPEAVGKLARRLSRLDVPGLRRRLRDWFSSWIATIDPGLPLADLGAAGKMKAAIPLNRRYVRPDVLVRFAEPAGEIAASKPPAPDPAVSQIVDAAGARSPRRKLAVAREERIDLNRFLRGERRVLISANAGMGKTTLLRMLALDLLSEKPKSELAKNLAPDTLPVWVPFALWTRMAEGRDVPPALDEIVHAFFIAHSEPEIAAQMRAAVLGGRILLLVDGLDEAVSEPSARTVSTVLATQVEAKDFCVLATSRPHGVVATGGLPASWIRAELAPLTEDQRDALATLWFEALISVEGGKGTAKTKKKRARARTVALAQALRRNPGIQQLAQTPLFLLALLQMHRQSQDLPRNRFAAIGKILEQLVEHQPHRRDSAALSARGSDLLPRQRDRLLAAFAFALQAGEFIAPINDAALQEEAVAKAAALLLQRQPDLGADRAEQLAASLFNFAEERAGLLVKRATGAIGFAHLSLQEFLAARHLAQQPLEERIAFVSARTGQSRWRAPILYLLHQETNEEIVNRILKAIQTAPVDTAHERLMRTILLGEGVFADFAHDPEAVRLLAIELMERAQSEGPGEARDRVLTSVVDGLSSESVGDLCTARLRRWLPDWHGYARSAALRVMPDWPQDAQAACKSVLLRSLAAEQESVRWASAEAIPRLKLDAIALQNEIAERVHIPASVDAMASALRCFSSSWAGSDQAARLSAASRRSADPGVALEAIRIRAARNETDAADFERFFEIRFARDSMFRFEERQLIEHFATGHRPAFINRLETCSRQSGGGSEKRSLIGALLLCDADNALAAKELSYMLERDFLFRSVVAEDFPADRIKWTPELEAQAQAYANQENAHFRDYELYWLAKVLPKEWLKARILENLKHPMDNHLWSAKALVEFWGAADGEVRRALIGVAEIGGEATASIAQVLPAVMTDKVRCRSMLLDCLSADQARVDFVIAGLGALNLGDDEEVFLACWEAGPKINGGELYKELWRDQIIRTFSRQARVRELANAELSRRFGQISATAETYGADPDMHSAILRAVDVMEASGRDVMIAQLRGAAFASEPAQDLLRLVTDDEDANVAAEGAVAWAEVVKSRDGATIADVEELRQRLFTMGSDFDQRRATALIALATLDRVDVFVDAVEIKGEKFKINLARPSYRGDDRYLRWMLRYWPELVKKLGGVEATIERLALSPEALLDLLKTDMPHSAEMYKLMMDRAPQYKHVRAHAILTAMARFEPQCSRLRGELRHWLLGDDHGEYWGGLVAAEIFAEQFAQDAALRADIVSALDTNEFAVAALAEYLLRHRDDALAAILHEKTLKKRFSLPIIFKLCAALSPPERLIALLEDTVSKPPVNTYILHLQRWAPAIVRRVERDPKVQDALTQTIGQTSAPMQVTAAALLSAAGAVGGEFRTRAEAEIVRQRDLSAPETGFDLLAQRFRLVSEALETATQ